MFMRLIILFLIGIYGSDTHCKANEKKPKQTHKANKKSKTSNDKKDQEKQNQTDEDPSKNILQPYGIEVNASHALLVDYQSGKVLLEKNADQLLEPASMTKIMTAYMIMRALKEGRIKETDLVTVSQYAYSREGSRMFLEIGQQVSVIELLKGILIVSGNDASVAMAEFLGGTEQNFAAEMTRVAKELGCTNTVFKNTSGIPEEGHHTTAKDLINMSIRLFEDFPEYYSINKETSYTFNKITQENRNLLLNKNLGCDGIKTGFAENPGYGMVASAVQKGRRLFLVCTGLRSKRQRADENIRLLQWGFQTFANYTIAPKGTAIVEIPVNYGTEHIVTAEAEPHFLTLNRVQLSQIKIQIKHPSVLRAPIKAGDVLGEAIITHPEWQAPVIVKLLAKQNVDESFFLNRIGQTLAYIFASKKAA